MMRKLARLVCAAALALAPHAWAASSRVPDISELWWNSAESGWGAHVTLQEDVAFLVLYVYDGQRQPRFFVAPAMALQSASGATEKAFRGELFRTAGSPFTAPFNPSAYVPTQVGEASLRYTTPGSATLTYTIEGVTVVKAITRQAYRRVDLTGRYRGGTFVATNGCTGGSAPPKISYLGTVEVSQPDETSVVIETRFDTDFAHGGHCVLRGRLEQTGSVAAIVNGAYNCDFDEGSLPLSGTFDITGIESGESGFFGRYVGHEGGPQCTHTGNFGGVPLNHHCAKADFYPIS